LPRAAHIANVFRARFEALQKRSPLIQQIRIKGTMIGVELSIDGTPIVDECLKRNLLINCTHGNVLRLLPALNLPDDALQAGCDIMEEVLVGQTF
jgi:acetylornithine/N-succinyldiaminopimelate aminotransferase